MTTAEKLKQEGMQKGSYNTLYSVIQTMRKNGFTDDNIAKMMNLEVSFVKKILSNKKIEIPLNLLRGEFEEKVKGSGIHS